VEERLQKLMAQAGLGSRRANEVLISAGRVTVNGRVAGLGDKADPQRDKILVDGRPLKLPEGPVYVALNKPRGVLSAVTSPDPRPTVRDLVDLPGHLYPVGRLDVDSEGLILLTSDGDLANRLTHPRYGHEKEYRVLVARRPDEEQIETWRRGVVLEDGYRTAPAEVRLDGTFGKGAWLRVVMKEGRKRQIRETGSQIGLPVVKIIRVRIGSLRLGNLKPREWRRLTDDEIAELKGRPTSKPAPAQSKPPAGSKPPWKKPASSHPSSGKYPAQKSPFPPSSVPKPGSGKSRQRKG
jgi:23S rRNA pseudouridine2605 synthase